MKNPITNQIQAYRERTREKLLADLGAFCRRAWREIEPGKALEWNWHHELLCEHLMLAYRGEQSRLIIAMPPRSLKSKLVSVFFPAWVWAKSPEQSFILTSYSDSLSQELNIMRRNLIQSPWFQESFPGRVIFLEDLNRREQYANTRGGHAIATSVEGTLTGKGATYLLVDDLLSPQQSYSDAERENANRFFDSTLRSRLNEPTTGVIIVVCQRLHERDLPGHLLEGEAGAWVLVNLPMVAEADEEIIFPLSGRRVERKAGDLLHAVRFPREWCKKTKATVGPYIWASQYLQRPAPAGGAIFKRDWFQEYGTLPEKRRVVLALDTAFSSKRTADYSAAGVWVTHEGKFFLAWMWRGRVEYPQLKNMAEELCHFWHPEAVLIEEKGSGQSLLQSLKQETSLPVVAYQVGVDKVSRAHAVTALFESGRVYFPKSAPWLADYLHELELFPSSAHDDQVDVTTMALAYMRSQGYEGGLGLVDLLKDMFAGRRKMPASAVDILETKAAKKETRVENFLKWQQTGKAPPCLACGNSATTYSETMEIRCNQCGAVGGVVRDPNSQSDFCCGEKMAQWAGGRPRCQHCGRQPEAPRVVGMSHAHLAAFRRSGRLF